MAKERVDSPGTAIGLSIFHISCIQKKKIDDILSVYKVYITMNTSSNRISPMLKLFGVLIPVIIVVATIILNTAFR